MQQETLNLSIRKFLKNVGVNSQREIEQAVNLAISNGEIKPDQTLKASMILEISGIKLNVKFDGDITLG